MLPTGDANAGRWRSLPYQVGILDAISDPTIERVTIQKSARVGYTKCFCAAVGYFIDHDPCPILIVQPTIDDAKKHSKEDLAPMLAEIPALQGLVAEVKSRDSDNTILDKQFEGGSLSLVGANSARGFRRTSRRVVIFDEVDGYPPSAGTEGDQIELGIKRTDTYWNRKIIAGSTPTIAGASRIEIMFAEGDQRRYYVPCPQCGEFQVLRFPNMKWPEDHPERAYFACIANGCVIEHRSKRDMVEAGQWRAEKPENFTEFNRHASFHIWAAYSYSPNATWGQLAAEWTKAARAGATTLKTVVNTMLGETWVEQGEAPDWERLMLRREQYALGTVPERVYFLTCGVDVQRERIEYEVVGWGEGKESWSIEYAIIPGDTADFHEGGPWRQLDALLARTFPHARGVEMPIALLAIDAGYNTNQVHTWARRYPTSRVIPVKGRASGAWLVGAPEVERTMRGTKPKYGGFKSWPVVGAIAKAELYGFLRLDPPNDSAVPFPPGFCHFPQHGPDYFKGLTAEQLQRSVIKRTNTIRHEWVILPGRRNEILDCRVYARAAANVVGLDRIRDWSAYEAVLGNVRPAASVTVGESGTKQVAPTVPDSTPPPPRREGGWLGRREGFIRRGGWLGRS